MKKLWFTLLAVSLSLALVLGGCGGNGGNASSPAASGDAGDSASGASEPAAPESTADAGAEKRIALVCDPAGTQVFILMMIDGLNNAAAKYGFEPIVVECPDSASYEDNMRALVEEGVDLIIAGGWQGGDAINKIATEFPDAAKYALIDSTVEAENVKCISYREQEGAYLVGMIAAAVTDEADAGTFGAVHVDQGPGSWKWRYGLMEGVKTKYPDAKFVFNYVGDYNDPAKAKELALLQYEQGARFINSAAAGGDSGVFEAALEKGFYTSGQDVDLTSPDNPYVVTCQIKDTKATMEYLLDNYFTKDWTTDNEEWGVAEGTIGAVYITHDSPNPMSDRISAEELAAIKQAAEDIRTGKLDFKAMPTEEEYGK